MKKPTNTGMWCFYAYESEEDFFDGNHYFKDHFTDFSKLEDFIIKHSSKEQTKHPNYYSTYFKVC